jgi:hypothetical protein
LAHAGKPVAASTQPFDTETTITIPSSLPPLDFSSLEATGSSGNVQSFVPPPSFQTFGRARLRTGGS